MESLFHGASLGGSAPRSSGIQLASRQPSCQGLRPRSNTPSCFLRGMRVSFCGPALPAVLPPFGQRNIREFLARDLPPVDRGSMTPCMRQNLSNMEKRIAADLASRKLHPGQLVVFAADRAVGKVYKAIYYTNTCPPSLPTTSTSSC